MGTLMIVDDVTICLKRLAPGSNHISGPRIRAGHQETRMPSAASRSRKKGMLGGAASRSLSVRCDSGAHDAPAVVSINLKGVYPF